MITLASMGVAAWALVIELMIALERKNVLSDRRSRRVIQGAVRGLRAMDELEPHAFIKIAYSLLEGQIDGWIRGGKQHG